MINVHSMTRVNRGLRKGWERKLRPSFPPYLWTSCLGPRLRTALSVALLVLVVNSRSSSPRQSLLLTSRLALLSASP